MSLLDRTADAAAGARVIGIVGPPGAGKSTLADALAPVLGAVVVPMDGYHYPQTRLVELGRRARMGAPDTFDREALAELLHRIQAGQAVVAPAFDRTIEEPVPAVIQVPAGARVIVEGNYLLLWPEVAELLDAVLYLPGDAQREARLRERHIRFGKTPDAADAWLDAVDRPNAELIATTATLADHILPPD